jgi:hypothetical protein
MSLGRFSPCCHLARVLVLVACGSWLACMGATPVPVRNRGPARAQIQTSALDMSFLELPAVQQQEVTDKLGSIDTGYRDPHLFWGRWPDSRIWRVKNLLITFDDNGVMQKREIIDDDRTLWRRLHEHVIAMPPLDLSEAEFLSVDIPNSLPILLHKEYFEVTAPKRGPVRIAPTSVLQFTHESTKDKRASAGTTCHTLHLAEKTSAGKNIRYCGSADKVVTLFRYLQETGAKTMKWE